MGPGGEQKPFPAIANKFNQMAMTDFVNSFLIDLSTKECIDFRVIGPLGELLKPGESWGSGAGYWSIGKLFGIDDSGRILANVSLKKDDAGRLAYSGLVMITPVPEPSTTWAFALIAGGLGLRRLWRRAAGQP